MVIPDSALDGEALSRARVLLRPPRVKDNLWPVLLAAAFAAVAALGLATSMILAPPVLAERPVVDRS